MDDRQRAIEILLRARELLVCELSERVVEMEESVLDDARGESYAGAIESLYEGLGMKLSNVNSLLAALRPRSEYAMPPAGFEGTPPSPVAQLAAYVQADTNEVVRTAPGTIDPLAADSSHDLLDEGRFGDG